MLIIHLQRIVFNLDIFINEKITSKRSFPMDLNMYPYSLECYEEKGKDRENRENSEKESDKEKENKEKESESKKDSHPEYDYSLVGIICHIGNADAGHYISYIKVDENKWLEFNDSIVSNFKPANIETECFGGNLSAYDDEFDWDKRENSKSAYILVYDRKGGNTIEMVLDSLESKG